MITGGRAASTSAAFASPPDISLAPQRLREICPVGVRRPEGGVKVGGMVAES